MSDCPIKLYKCPLNPDFEMSIFAINDLKIFKSFYYWNWSVFDKNFTFTFFFANNIPNGAIISEQAWFHNEPTFWSLINEFDVTWTNQISAILLPFSIHDFIRCHTLKINTVTDHEWSSCWKFTAESLKRIVQYESCDMNHMIYTCKTNLWSCIVHEKP